MQQNPKIKLHSSVETKLNTAADNIHHSCRKLHDYVLNSYLFSSEEDVINGNYYYGMNGIVSVVICLDFNQIQFIQIMWNRK